MAVTLIAVFVGIAHYRNRRELRIFIYYSFFSLLTDLTDYIRYAMGMDKPFPLLVQALATYLFMVFEFFAFSYFILSHVKDIRRKRVIKTIPGVFLIFLVLCMILHLGFIYYWNFYLFESILLTIPCLIYFYELYMHGPEVPLKALPAFWVITGILMVNCCSIPLYLTMAYLDKYMLLAYNLIYLLYTALFCMVIRANLATG